MLELLQELLLYAHVMVRDRQNRDSVCPWGLLFGFRGS